MEFNCETAYNQEAVSNMAKAIVTFKEDGYGLHTGIL